MMKIFGCDPAAGVAAEGLIWYLIYMQPLSNSNHTQNDETPQAQPLESPYVRMLIAVKNGDEDLAVDCASQVAAGGLIPVFDDPVMQWKFFLIHVMTRLSDEYEWMEGSEQMEAGSQGRDLTDFVRRVYRARRVKECRLLLVDLVKIYCGYFSRQMAGYCLPVRYILESVDLDLTQPLTLQYFADQLGLNRSYLSHLFSDQMGCTITAYVTGRRLQQARLLLATTQDPVHVIAAQVGIPDAQYFGRLFRREYGMSPSHFRRSLQE